VDYLNQDKTWLAGVSGGRDSMALLDMMRRAGYRVAVAHVNYNIREDTQEDLAVVESYCSTYDIPLHVKTCDHDYFNTGNVQVKAREIRYSFYKKLCESHGYAGVVLAHHRDDVLETIVMHKRRGSRPDYLGIRPVSLWQGMQVVRPLLKMTKADLTNYCETHGVIWHDDYTNFQTDYTRDYVRNVVLKQMPEAEKEQLLSEARDFNVQSAQKRRHVQPLLDEMKENGIIQLSCIDDPETFWYWCLREVLEQEDISGHVIREIIRQMNSSGAHATVALADGFEVIKAYDEARLVKKTDVTFEPLTFDPGDYPNNGIVHAAPEGHDHAGVCVHESDWPLTVRSFCPGDRILTKAGHKKVSRLMIDAKVPKDKRTLYPVLVNRNGEILLVPYLAKRVDRLGETPDIYIVMEDA